MDRTTVVRPHLLSGMTWRPAFYGRLPFRDYGVARLWGSWALSAGNLACDPTYYYKGVPHAIRLGDD